MIKKLLSLILAMAFALSLCNTFALTTEQKITEESKYMDSTEVIITAYSYAAGTSDYKRTDDTRITVTNIVPLYDTSDKIVAYYVTFSTNEYAVVNNNVENPTVIEFGEGVQNSIEAIIKGDSKAKIIYNNPISVYESSYIKALSAKGLSKLMCIDKCYPDLSVKNEYLANKLQNTKEKVIKSNSIVTTKGDGDYGFIYPADMPSGTYTSDTILYATTTDWAEMDDYNNIANNHCGATTVTNIALYYAKRGYTNLKINNSKTDTFKAVHKIVGDGPVMTIAGKAVTYFSNRGYSLSHSDVGNNVAIKTATTNDRPCGILLADGLFAWHWVIGVGWREYTSSGDFYIRINDNWYGNANRYYKPGTGSAWWSATSYWVN